MNETIWSEGGETEWSGMKVMKLIERNVMEWQQLNLPNGSWAKGNQMNGKEQRTMNWWAKYERNQETEAQRVISFHFMKWIEWNTRSEEANEVPEKKGAEWSRYNEVAETVNVMEWNVM